MHLKYILLTAAIVGCLIDGAVSTAGSKDHGDSCNLISSGVQFFETVAGGNDNYGGACDLDKGLVCTINICTCLPGYEYKQHWYQSVFGGGKCVPEFGSARGNAGGLLPTFQVLLAAIIFAFANFSF